MSDDKAEQGGGQQTGQPERPKPDKLQTITKGKENEPGVEKRG